MGQVTTSKQRTPHPLASPSDKVGATGGKTRGAKMHQASLWTNAPGLTRGRTGRQRSQGTWKTSSRPCLGETEHPLRRRRRCANEPASKAASAEPLGSEARPGGPVWPPPPPRLHGNGRPRPGCPRLGPASLLSRPRMPGLLLGPTSFTAPLSARPATGPGPLPRADHPRPQQGSPGDTKGENKKPNSPVVTDVKQALVHGA
jgi:hypothetical protein